MAPRWFAFDEVPYEMMWDEHKLWMPRILKEKGDGQVVFYHVQFRDVWDVITQSSEEWVAVEQEHGGRDGDLGRRALQWLEGVREAPVKV